MAAGQWSVDEARGFEIFHYNQHEISDHKDDHENLA
jgi:hypothetical protein